MPKFFGEANKLQKTPPMAKNQTSTERSTCTTSAVENICSTGSLSAKKGPRNITGGREYKPAAANADMASSSHFFANICISVLVMCMFFMEFLAKNYFKNTYNYRNANTSPTNNRVVT